MAKSSDTLRPNEPDATVAFWLSEISTARKREQLYRKDGERILKIYDGSASKTVPFNILFSNTETLLPALYSALPRPVVERRFKDDDPLGKAASDAGTRMLSFLLDTNLHDYDDFDSVMRSTTLDALLPGRGTAKLTYDATVTDVPNETDETTTAPDSMPTPTVSYEMVCLEAVNWARAYYGYAKTWMKVPWIAFESYIDKQEATRLFGLAKAKKLRYSHADPESEELKGRESLEEDRYQGAMKTACLYQIWDKQGGKRVLYLSPQYPDGLLKEDDDPLQLSGFYPCPEPLHFIEKTHTLLPTALYTIYENQAMELNIIQLRINRLVAACKARGIYDGSLGSEIQKLMEADENELIPADSASSLSAEKGFGNAVWFWPLEVIQSTLATLYQSRESCKQVIYEITGISDILRGASQASETATAQNIKNQWGTLRLKRLQKSVANYARDLMRLMLELAASKFSEESWAKMTGLPYLTSAKYQQLMQLAQAAQQQIHQQPMLAQQAQQNPQVMQAVQQIQQQLQQPQWSQVLALLKEDLYRAYKIDIESNSTVEPSATEDRQQMTDLLTALAQYVQGVAPLVANGVMPFQVVQSIMLLITRQFPAGSKVEDYIRQMQPPAPKPDDGQAQQQMLQVQQQQQQGQMQMQQKEAEMALQVKSLQAEKALLEKSVDLQLREIQLKAEEEKFACRQQVAQETLAMREKVQSVKTSATDQVRTLKDQSAKKEAQAAHMADTKLSSSVGAIESVTQQMAQMNASLLSAIQGQAEQTAQVLGEVTKAVSAPRRRKAIRGTDGRIEAVEDQPA